MLIEPVAESVWTDDKQRKAIVCSLHEYGQICFRFIGGSAQYFLGRDEFRRRFKFLLRRRQFEYMENVGRNMTAEPIWTMPQAYAITMRDWTQIGFVEWSPKKKQYVFSPAHDTAITADMMSALSVFVRECTSNMKK